MTPAEMLQLSQADLFWLPEHVRIHRREGLIFTSADAPSLLFNRVLRIRGADDTIDGLPRLLQFLRVVVGNTNPHAPGGEILRCRQTDAIRPTGDHGNIALVQYRIVRHTDSPLYCCS